MKVVLSWAAYSSSVVLIALAQRHVNDLAVSALLLLGMAVLILYVFSKSK